jgi:O-antigen/teichoic acid export membrane protein
MSANMNTSDITQKRTKRLVKNIVASFVVKGWSAVVVLLMVPLTLKCLGIYQNGVWLTISSLLVWIDQMDIGLGNGLRNRLAMHQAHGESVEARQTVSSTIFMLVCIIIPVFMLLSVLVWYGDIYGFLNVEAAKIPELRTTLLCAVTLVCMTFVLKFIGNVYMGMQLPAISNGIMATGQTLAMIATWILFITDRASFTNVVIANVAAPLIIYFISYPITFYVKFPQLRPTWESINIRTALQLGNTGVKFFWLQIASIIQFMTANILISKFFTPEMVTPYQIAYRYMSIVLVFFTVICTPIWNATTDAYERNDLAWIRKASKKLGMLSMLVFVMLTAMTIVSPWVYRVWIGDSCHVPFDMTLLMAIYIFLMTLSMRYSYFLNGIGALRLQIYMTVTAVIFIPLAWYASQTTHNIIWFMIVMCLCNLPGIIVNIIQFNKILNRKATGVWKK